MMTMLQSDKDILLEYIATRLLLNDIDDGNITVPFNREAVSTLRHRFDNLQLQAARVIVR